MVARRDADGEDPLRQKYTVASSEGVAVVLGSGADGGVVRGIDRRTNEWHALFFPRAAYGSGREVSALRKVSGHPDIVTH